MSCRKKNSVRDKVIAKKWIYCVGQKFVRVLLWKNPNELFGQPNIYRETHPTGRVWAISEGERALKYGVVSFYGLGNFIG